MSTIPENRTSEIKNKSKSKLKFASMGIKLADINYVSFLSNDYIQEYDCLIWYPEYIFEVYKNIRLEQNGYFVFHPHELEKLRSEIRKRIQDMLEMLELGRTIIISIPSPILCYRTVRGSYTIEDLTDDLFPINMGINEISVNTIEFSGHDPLKSFWEIIEKEYEIKPKAALEIYDDGTPFLYTRDNNKVLGSYHSISNGHIICIPRIYAKNTDGDWHKPLITALTSLLEELAKEGSDFSLPDWSDNYLLPSESEYKADLSKLVQEMENIYKKIQEKKVMIKELEKYKILFCCKSIELETQCKKIFEELGFEAEKPEGNRKDLILKYGKDKIAVVEIKGKDNRSAGEDDIMQLEKWKIEYHDSHKKIPKGILVANMYKDTPLNDRKQTAFPDQLLPLATGRELCLITGTQLLCLYLDYKRNPSKKDQLIDSLFNTVGIYKDYEDWGEYITFEE